MIDSNPGTEEGKSNVQEEESYEFTLEFPEQKVPLIFKNGKTEPLIPKERDDILTKRSEGDDEDNTEDQPTIETIPPEELMDSFDQIQMEQEAKDIIEGYQKERSPDELERLDEIEDEFGAKNPGEIDFWRDVWEHYNIEFKNGIPEGYLPKAVGGSIGLTQRKAERAVEIGKEFDLIIEGKTENAVELEYIPPNTDDTILRLTLPEERPDLYADNLTQFADRDKWVSIWESFGFDKDVKMSKPMVERAIQNKENADEQTAIRAILEVGRMAGCIIENGEEFILSGERPDEYWLEVWKITDTDYDDPLPQEKITQAIAIQDNVHVDEARETFNEATSNNEIYSPPEIPDNEYLINDPATDEGPDIDNSGSDDDDGDNGAEIEDSPDSDTPDGQKSQATSEATNGTGESITTDTTPEGTEAQTADGEPSETQPQSDGSTDQNSSDSTPPTQTAQDGSESIDEEDGPNTTQDQNAESQRDVDEEEPAVAEEGSQSEDGQDNAASESTTDSAATSSDITTTETTANDSGSDGSEDSVSNTTTQESDITLTGGDSDGSRSNGSGATGDADSDVPDEVVDEYGSESAFDQDTPEGGINPEGGVPDEEISMLSNAGDDGSSSRGDNPDEESVTSKHERFKTYSDPGDEVGEFDADREAVKQFVNQFATVDPHSKDETYTKRETVYNAFTTWYKINGLNTPKLTADHPESNRKGNLKNTLTTLFDLEVDRKQRNGVRTKRYHGIELSDMGEELAQLNIE